MVISSERLAHSLLELAHALRDAGVPFAIAGAYAVAMHGHPRATRDIDVLTRAEFRQSVGAVMLRLGYVALVPNEAFAGYERRPVPDLPAIVERVDFLFSTRELGVRTLAEAARQPLMWREVALPVVPVDALILMKVMAVADDPSRPNDLRDARVLLQSHRAALDLAEMRHDADAIGAPVRTLLEELLSEHAVGEAEAPYGPFRL